MEGRYGRPRGVEGHRDRKMKSEEYIKEKKRIAKATIKKERGWTDLLIKRFLKTPDLVVDNPHYKCAGQMNLYLIERIESIEATPEFKAMMESANGRKKKASQAVETKRSKIMAHVNGLNIVVPEMPEQELREKAVKSFNDFKEAKAMRRDDYEFEPATVNSDETFLNRISMNYLRHKCTKYERELNQIFGKVGVDDAYVILKEKINGAILEKYPFLKP